MRWWAAAVVVLVGCGRGHVDAAAGRPSAHPESRFKLKYAWPAGDREVRVLLERGRIRDAATDRREVVATYALHVDDDGVVSTSGARTLLPADAPADLLARLAIGSWPGLRIDRRGTFDALADPDAVTADIQAMLVDVAPEQQPALAAVLSLDAIAAGASSDWHELVGRWAGRAFTVGESVDRTSSAAVEALGGVTVDTVQHDTLVAVVACVPDGPLVCVRLRHEEVLDAAGTLAISEVLQRTSAAAFAEAGMPVETEVRSIDYLVSTEIVADPATLVPYSLVETRRIGAQVAVGDRVVEIGQSDTISRSYSD